MRLCLRRRAGSVGEIARPHYLSPMDTHSLRVGWRLLAGLRARAAYPEPSVSSLEIASERLWKWHIMNFGIPV